MPFTHIYYGSDEVLRASCDLLTAAFEKAGSEYELHIGEGMFHCYPAIRFIPECRKAFDEIVGYLS
jgi:acetyl esterase/lipase